MTPHLSSCTGQTFRDAASEWISGAFSDFMGNVVTTVITKTSIVVALSGFLANVMCGPLVCVAWVCLAWFFGFGEWFKDFLGGTRKLEATIAGLKDNIRMARHTYHAQNATIAQRDKEIAQLKLEAKRVQLEGPFIAHARSRVQQLRSALAANLAVLVTIAGDGVRHLLGSGLAVEQWQRYWPEGGEAARVRFVAALQTLFDGLITDYPGRVFYGDLDRRMASPTHLLVWGANAANEQGTSGSPITGEGQAAAMGTYGPGVFGLITTPKNGMPPPPERLVEEQQNFAANAARDTSARQRSGVAARAARRARTASPRSTGSSSPHSPLSPFHSPFSPRRAQALNPEAVPMQGLSPQS